MKLRGGYEDFVKSEFRGVDRCYRVFRGGLCSVQRRSRYIEVVTVCIEVFIGG